MTYPIGIGRVGWETPLGDTTVVAKATDPHWYVPASVRKEHAEMGDPLPSVVPPGPDNPLGDYAIRLALPGYLIHGTNRPAGVGMRVTHGCIRLFPEDIEWLFPRVPVDTRVRIVNQPLKFGWLGDELYLEVHPTLDAESTGDESALLASEFVRATADRLADVDWDRIAEVFRDRRGMPVKVGQLSAAMADDAAACAEAGAASIHIHARDPEDGSRYRLVEGRHLEPLDA